MRFIEDQSSSFVREKFEEQEDTDRGNLTYWTIAILVLLGLNIGSWVFCNLVFGHPETPFSYRFLTQIEKIEPVRGFNTSGLPRSKFGSAKDHFEIVYSFSKSQLRAYNGILKRNYLWNYKEKSPASCIRGNFLVEKVRALSPDDLFVKGISVLATAERFPDAKVELILPTADPVFENDFFRPGDLLTLPTDKMAAAVIHVTRNGEEPTIFRAVPLVTKTASGENLTLETPSGKKLVLETPQWLNIR